MAVMRHLPVPADVPARVQQRGWFPAIRYGAPAKAGREKVVSVRYDEVLANNIALKSCGLYREV